MFDNLITMFDNFIAMFGRSNYRVTGINCNICRNKEHCFISKLLCLMECTSFCNVLSVKLQRMKGLKAAYV